MSAEIKRHFADLSEVSLHYLTAGSGEPLVLLHGIPQTSHEWRHIIPKLSDRFSIVAPDLRGCGEPSRPVTGYDKRRIAEDVWELVHGHLGIERFYPLPASIRDIIVRNVNEAAVRERADVAKLNAELQSELTAKGLTFFDVDTAAFRKTLQSSKFYVNWKEKFGEESWSLLESVSGKLV